MYVDNFRGFKETVLPLKDVNFLVGENSTGKSSLLALIDLVADLRFWIRGTPAFHSEEVNLGNFRDIVSAGAKDRSYFRIGLFAPTDEADKAHEDRDSGLDAYLVTFREREGMPVISRYTFMTEGIQVHVKFSGSTIAYRHEEPCALSSDHPVRAEDVFRSWTREHEKSWGSYRTLRTPIPAIHLGLGALNSILLTEIRAGRRRPETRRGIHLEFRAICPFQSTTMLAPIRTRPKRTYDEYNTAFSAEGEHTPYLIKRYFRRSEERDKFLQFIDRFGKESGLFKTISIKNFGRAATSPFELDVAIDSTLLKIVDVGYGVSQVLPVVVEVFERSQRTCFLIQQPEIHLHPRAQAALGDLFYELAKLERKCFVVETHSDFIIDSFRLRYREKAKTRKPEGQIVYFERFDQGNRLSTIEILENGELSEEQPEGYRDFFMREQLRMLGY